MAKGNKARRNRRARAARPELARSEDGVDLTLIRWMLSLTPAQRLRALQSHLRSILRLRAENERP
jgi:hypothetical protein